MNMNAYILDMLSTMQTTNILHVSLLNSYTEPVMGHLSVAQYLLIVNITGTWEVDCTLNSRQCLWMIH